MELLPSITSMEPWNYPWNYFRQSLPWNRGTTCGTTRGTTSINHFHRTAGLQRSTSINPFGLKGTSRTQLTTQSAPAFIKTEALCVRNLIPGPMTLCANSAVQGGWGGTKILEAAENCPVSAITVEDAETGEKLSPRLEYCQHPIYE